MQSLLTRSIFQSFGTSFRCEMPSAQTGELRAYGCLGARVVHLDGKEMDGDQHELFRRKKPVELDREHALLTLMPHASDRVGFRVATSEEPLRV